MRVSIIIPVYNAAEHLESSLAHLTASTEAPLECIVVDDGSTDGSADVARRRGAKVLSTEGRTGPAHARNQGALAAKGDILFFLDSDVCVHPDTLARVRQDFEGDPGLDALIGSYDATPGSGDFLSQYKNLMHCYVHQHGKRDACTFWSGCGAIRRDVFLQHSGFDESYSRPAVEDIELGYRLRSAGRKVVLDKDLLVTHLKRWTFWGLLKTDILDRGIPWTELILRDRCMPNDLNLELSQRVSVALSFMLLFVTSAAAIYWGGYFLTPLLALLMLLLSRYWLEFAAGPRSPVVIAMMVAIVSLIVWLAIHYRMKDILPPLLLGCLLLLLRHRRGPPAGWKHRISDVGIGLYIVAVTVYMVMHLPYHYWIFAFFVVGALIVILNNRFYLFLAAKRGRLFALAALPFHILYHLYNGFSFMFGLIHYSWTILWRKKTTVACAAATRRVV